VVRPGALARRHHAQRVAEEPRADRFSDRAVPRLELVTVCVVLERDVFEIDDGLHARTVPRVRARVMTS